MYDSLVTQGYKLGHLLQILWQHWFKHWFKHWLVRQHVRQQKYFWPWVFVWWTFTTCKSLRTKHKISRKVEFHFGDSLDLSQGEIELILDQIELNIGNLTRKLKIKTWWRKLSCLLSLAIILSAILDVIHWPKLQMVELW